VALVRLEAEEAKAGYWAGTTKPLSITLEDAGIQISDQATGLYFPLTPESTGILKRYPESTKDAAIFMAKGHKWCEVRR
jgi:hypothetical protein